MRRSGNYELITIISEVHGQWGPKQRRSIRHGRLGIPWPSYLFWGVPDTEVDDARESSHDADLTWLLSLPTWDRCGRASLPPALAYDLQSTDEGTGLPVRRRLVPSCNSGRWRFTRGYTIPGLGYLLRCWLPGYLCRKVLHRAYCFYQVLCTLRWNHYCVYACIHVRATLMGWIPALECIVSGVHGLL
jgi:hypothetical protein